LKNVYVQKDIDISEFIGDKSRVGLPIEPYIYQNFFLLRNGDEYLLLDGFRRLLQENVPNVDVVVNIYDYYKMTDVQLIQLMFGLNHQKFFTTDNNCYNDRGFALLFKSIWNLDLSKIVHAINGYSIVKGYNWDSRDRKKAKGENHYLQLLNAINEYFIEDLQFFKSCLKEGLLVDELFGEQVKKYRLQTEKSFYGVLNELSKDKTLIEQIVKLPSARSYSQVRGYIADLYARHFTMYVSGVEKELSFTEKEVFYKQELKRLEKDKNYFKLTVDTDYSGTQSAILKEKIEFAKQNGKKIVGVIKPYETNDCFGVVDLKIHETGRLFFNKDGKYLCVVSHLMKDANYMRKKHIGKFFATVHYHDYVETNDHSRKEQSFLGTLTNITVFIEK
jgi:hypothetical protein